MEYIKRGWKKGNKRDKSSRDKMSKTKTKLFAEGKLIVWNKGLTFRKGKYVSQYKHIYGRNNIPIGHYAWINQSENLGFIPKGFVIHHIDFNQNNNNLDNLFLMEDREHRILHNAISKKMRDNNLINTGGQSGTY